MSRWKKIESQVLINFRVTKPVLREMKKLARLHAKGNLSRWVRMAAVRKPR